MSSQTSPARSRQGYDVYPVRYSKFIRAHWKGRQDKRHLRNNTPNVRKRGMLTTETVLMNLFTNIWLEEYNKKEAITKLEIKEKLKYTIT